MEYLHFDPVTLLVLILGFIGTWVTLRNDSKWHGAWIKKHAKDCEDLNASYGKMFTELQVGNAKLGQLAEQSAHRIDRIENFMDRERGVGK